MKKNKTCNKRDVVYLVYRPTIPTIPTIPLNTKELVLSSLFESISISEISSKLNISLDIITKTIQRKDRGTGLLYDGFIEAVSQEGKVIKYKITEEGLDHLESIYKAHKQKQEMKERISYEHHATTEVIKKFGEFFDTLKKEFLKQLNKDNKYIEVDFHDLSKFCVEIAERLLDKPEEIIKLAEIGLESSSEDYEDMKVRFKNLPNSEFVSIGEIRHKHMNKLIKVVGSVVSLSDVRPHVTYARFECPSCGNIINVIQTTVKFKEPTRCGCGRKGKFKLLDKEFRDAQLIKLEELSEDLKGRTQQKNIKVFLSDDLTHIENQPFFEKSEPIIINGIVKELPIIDRCGNKLCRFDLILEANSVEFNENLRKVNLTSEVINKCKEMSKLENVEDHLVNSFASNIFEKKMEKKGLLYSLVSGGDESVKFRDDSHVLLIGDAGVGKSSLLKECHKLSVGSRWISGKGSTGAGLIGTVTKDSDFGGEVVLQKGALPMSNQSVSLCDELDKMAEQHTDSLHEALENQVCSIDKWNKHQQFKTDCTFIAAANPKKGMFDMGADSLVDQIALPKPLIDRFDLIMPFIDVITPDDIKLAQKIGDLFQGKKGDEEIIDSEDLRNYIFYARTLNPTPTDEALKKINKYWVLLRTSSVGCSSKINISARQLNALNRLSRSSAKLRLSNVADVTDANNAIILYDYFIKKMGLEVIGPINEEGV